MSALIREARDLRRLPKPELARAIRRAAGVSQVAVASELRVHPVTVARWEAGKRRPQGSTAAAYVRLLDELRAVTDQ